VNIIQERERFSSSAPTEINCITAAILYGNYYRSETVSWLGSQALHITKRLADEFVG